MTKSDIKKYYKLFAIVNIISGIIFILIFSEIKLSDRIITASVINLGYHMFYQFFSSIISGDIHFLKKNNSASFLNIGKGMMKFFSFIAIGMSFLIAFQLIYFSLSQAQYIGFFALFIPLGLFLGGYSLMLNLNNDF